MKNNRFLLSAEILQGVFVYLRKKHNASEMNLSPKIRVEIAKDVDGVMPLISYMIYKSMFLVKFNGKSWIFSRGEVCGNYPDNPYISELIAVSMPKPIVIGKELNLLKKIKGALAGSGYFRNSLICEVIDGRVVINRDSCYHEKMLGVLESKIQEFVFQANTKSPRQYKPEFIKFLGDSIETVLMSF
jgi:hypothetical protein